MKSRGFTNPVHGTRLITLLIAALFGLLRGYDLGADYLWNDDVYTISYTSFESIPAADLIGESFQHSLDTTGPFVPTLILKTINNLTGPQIAILRLPSLVIGLLTLLLLAWTLARLFMLPAARLLPLVLFTFSIPTLLYSRSIQPSIYYALTSSVQIALFVPMVQALTPATSPRRTFRQFQLFTLVSTLLFFINYMSALVHIILIGCYITLLVVRGWQNPRMPRKAAAAIFNASLVALPLAALVYIRLRVGESVTRPYFDDLYYPAAPGDVPRLAYDFLAYHFNFAYQPDVYEPLGSNWLALPFSALFGVGVIAFVWHRPDRLATLSLGVIAVLVAGWLRILPVGGVRHSLTFAPFVYLLVGYGVQAIYRALPALWPDALRQGLPSLTYAALAGVIFIVSGTRFYETRQHTLDLSMLIAWAEAYDVDMVVGNCENYLILAMLDADDRLAAHGIALVYACNAPPELPERIESGARYLLVDHRRTFNPDPSWPPLGWDIQIPADGFAGATITPLIEDPGPLDPQTMGVQSIYYPLNGFFVYLVE